MHLHAYAGRETGLMIIGNSEDLSSLGRKLLEVSESQPPKKSYNWPHQVLVLDAPSPYLDRTDYEVSFYLQSEPLPESLLKRPRQAPTTAMFLGVALLALVGAVSVPVWLWKAFS